MEPPDGANMIAEPAWLNALCPGGLSWDGCSADECGVHEDGTGCRIALGTVMAECTCDYGDAHPNAHQNYCETRHPYHLCTAESCRFYEGEPRT